MVRLTDSNSLSTLLSQTLVSLIIEFDNEAERRAPHWTTSSGKGKQEVPWLVSLAMLTNCLQYLPEEGITVKELLERARTPTNLPGMVRWGYVVTDRSEQPRTSAGFKPETILRPTQAGLAAKEALRTVAPQIEGRWRARFGEDRVIDLRESLAQIARRIHDGLPDLLPILHYGLGSRGPTAAELFSDEPDPEFDAGSLPLYALLSKVLLAFGLSYESGSKISLAIGANVLRLLSDEPCRISDLPQRSGVSKEAIAMATGFLEKADLILIEPFGAIRQGKGICLTERGKVAKERYFLGIAEVEASWKQRFGAGSVEGLRKSLEALTTGGSSLFEGLTAYPGSWRSKAPAKQALPHFPMVLHRGGYPDGS
jgi:hypothetical protein